MTTRLLIAFLVYWTTILIGSPASDIGSPSQQTRDAAAEILRTNYTVPSRTNWDLVMGTITNGMKKTNMLELLSPFHVTLQSGVGMGVIYSETYRLDDVWDLVCRFGDGDDKLIDSKLASSMSKVWFEPPTNFSGVWITYYVNGQMSHEINYEAGKYHGDLIAYLPDGTKTYVQHYEHGIIEGPCTAYGALGRTKYRGMYHAGNRVGTWVWYNEDGSTNSTREYPTQ